MATSLDLNLLPVARYAGREYPELLSLYAAEPPRRSARGREADRLILYLAVAGNAPLPPGKQDQVLADLAKLFFATPGSVTAALRRVAEELNKLLLERNLHLTSSSRQGIGLLTQAVLRGSQLYLAASGPVNFFLVTADQTEHYFDPEMADRGLGQGRSTPISFFQSTLQPNDTLIMAVQPAPSWSVENLTGLHGQGPESLRRRLFNQAIPDINAVMVQARTGKGAFYLPKPGKPGAAPSAVEEEQPVAQPPTALPAAETGSCSIRCTGAKRNPRNRVYGRTQACPNPCCPSCSTAGGSAACCQAPAGGPGCACHNLATCGCPGRAARPGPQSCRSGCYWGSPF